MATVKFAITIPKELNDSINKFVPWGLKCRLFRAMLFRLEYELRNDPTALSTWLTWEKSQ